MHNCYTVEDGFGPVYGSRGRFRRGVKLVILAALVAGSITCVYIASNTTITRNKHFVQIEAKMNSTNSSCLSAYHASLGNKALFTVQTHNKIEWMIAPHILHYGAKKIISLERNILCLEEKPREYARHEFITVQFRTHPFYADRSVALSGSASYCVQHMLEVARGNLPCNHAVREEL